MKNGKYHSAKRKAPLINSLILPVFFDIPKLRFYTNNFLSNEISHHKLYFLLKMEGLAQLRGNMMKPNSSCLHPQYLSPFINSCTLNRDTVCHPISPFSSAKVKELILWKHLSSLKQRCCGNITGVLLVTRCLYKQLPICCVHYRVLSPGVLRIDSHSHTGLLRPVAV